MNLDKIINFLLDIFDSPPSKNGDQITINKNFINKKSDVLKVIIPPRGKGDLFITRILIKRFSKKGYSSLSYYLNEELLSNDINQALKNFDILTKEIIQEIDRLKKEYNFKKIDLIAPSLGVVSACIIANNNENINNLYLLVPGNNLASSLWEGIRTRNMKLDYELQGITEKNLQNTWEKLDPENNMEGYENKKIFIAISKSDKIIPYKFGKKFADIIKNKYPKNTTIVENKYLGHYFTVLKYYLFKNSLLD